VQPRAYSIASAPAETRLRFIIKLVPNGRASRWVEHGLQAGMTMAMQAPFGVFTLDTVTEKPYLFLATGTGVAPLRSQILHALRERNDTRPMRLVFGVLWRRDLFWMDEWQALQSEYPQLRVEAVILEEDGSMQDRIPCLVGDFSAVSVYVCGSPEMVRDVKRRCMEWGVPKEDIHAESYI
jgi:benzoate/toluate 1,2-dioxygenase reductase subunit